MKCLALARLPRILAEPDADPLAILLGDIDQQSFAVAADSDETEVRFAHDSPLEGDGFEPSVPRKIWGCPVDPPQFTFRNINRLARDRDRRPPKRPAGPPP
jgi:hypothetical protein